MAKRKSLIGLDLARPVEADRPASAAPAPASPPPTPARRGAWAAGLWRRRSEWRGAARWAWEAIRGRWRRRGRWVDHLLAAAFSILFLCFVFLSTGVGRSALPLDRMKTDPQPPLPLEKGEAKKIRARLPNRSYLAVDRSGNTMWLRKGDGTLVKRMVVSAGSGGVLEEPNGKRVWVFDTPLGVFTVKGMQDNPVWVKPDWAFIEEGEPIPKNYADRFEPGMLGEYALSLGDGYLIHGTLYERLLGRNVTHGCIRVGRDDLRLVVKNIRVGDRVYIF